MEVLYCQLLCIEFTMILSFLNGRKSTVNFLNQRLRRHPVLI